jgi:hypothetical protein
MQPLAGLQLGTILPGMGKQPGLHFHPLFLIPCLFCLIYKLRGHCMVAQDASHDHPVEELGGMNPVVTS